jgi:hypothetical protein
MAAPRAMPPGSSARPLRRHFVDDGPAWGAKGNAIGGKFTLRKPEGKQFPNRSARRRAANAIPQPVVSTDGKFPLMGGHRDAPRKC